MKALLVLLSLSLSGCGYRQLSFEQQMEAMDYCEAQGLNPELRVYWSLSKVECLK